MNFKKSADIVYALPGWLYVRAAIPLLPKTHAWSGKKFHLLDWTAGRTNNMRIVDALMWYTVVLIISLSVHFFTKA